MFFFFPVANVDVRLSFPVGGSLDYEKSIN
jgi:hypothetical protein